MTANLPNERLAFTSRPFTNTGVDYFGPFYVSVKRFTEKRWGFLFTCLTTRAVHFEVVQSMDTSSCVMGNERNVSRRGIPTVIWSDNGTNFVATEKELLQNILLGTAGSSLPSHSNCDFDHRKRYARAQAYSDAIWNRWLKEYIPTLNRRSKWPTQSDSLLKTEDLVWIVEPTSPRGYYPLARLVARSAEVKTTSGNLFGNSRETSPSISFPDLTDLS